MPIIKKENSSQQIINYILEKIEKQEWKCGDRLPNERDFSESLGVSRVPLREAICALSHLGILEIRPGSGTYVSSYDPAVFGKIIYGYTLLGKTPTDEIAEARALMEADIARLAARNASDGEIEALAAAIQKNDEAIEKLRRGEIGLPDMFRLDDEVHATIAKASHNEFFYQFVDAIRRSSYEQHIFDEAYADGPDSFQDASNCHHAILAAIRAHDPRAAYIAMYHHIEHTEYGRVPALSKEELPVYE